MYSAVAQLVERLAVNEDVLGSNPSRGASQSVFELPLFYG